jgi:hypothetical protein
MGGQSRAPCLFFRVLPFLTMSFPPHFSSSAHRATHSSGVWCPAAMAIVYVRLLGSKAVVDGGAEDTSTPLTNARFASLLWALSAAALGPRWASAASFDFLTGIVLLDGHRKSQTFRCRRFTLDMKSICTFRGCGVPSTGTTVRSG